MRTERRNSLNRPLVITEIPRACGETRLSGLGVAADAVKGRVRWSNKLRQDHRLLAALEKLMQRLGPAGSRVPVQYVTKVVPFVGVFVGASMNSAILGSVAADAQWYC